MHVCVCVCVCDKEHVCVCVCGLCVCTEARDMAAFYMHGMCMRALSVGGRALCKCVCVVCVRERKKCVFVYQSTRVEAQARDVGALDMYGMCVCVCMNIFI